MAFRMRLRVKPNKFKSVKLPNAIKNLGKLPLQLERIGSLINKRIKINLSGRILNKRTGVLHDSWDYKVKAASPGWRLTISSDVVYAAIHNFGGWTGKGHASKIKKTRYVDKAVIQTKRQVRALLKKYTVKIWR